MVPERGCGITALGIECISLSDFLAQLLGRPKFAVFGCRRLIGDEITPELVYCFAVWRANSFADFLIKARILFDCVKHTSIRLTDALLVWCGLRCIQLCFLKAKIG